MTDVFFYLFLAESERKKFMGMLDGRKETSVYTINRATLFSDILSLYTKDRDKVGLQYSFRFRFKDERAVDAGGVTRDAFSAFFEETYLHFFDGTCLLHPAVHASIDMPTYSVLGEIISHAYLVAGVFPDRVAFPSLVAALLGPERIVPDPILQEIFISSLSTHEASIIMNALSVRGLTFKNTMKTELVTILGCHGCRGIPQPSTLMQHLIQAARYTFLIQPAAALHIMNGGIPSNHRPFWKRMTVDNFYSIYSSLSVSKAKVLNLLKEPSLLSVSQEEIYQYLKRFIGNMSGDELRTFLRFVTGSFVISVPAIDVVFNSLDGLARRPISHTCSATLEISSTYASLPEFVAEFRTVLSDPVYSWRMDSV